MSRIGRQTIDLPSGVKLSRDGDAVHIEGPKGKLSGRLPTEIEVSVEENTVAFKRQDDRKQTRAYHGLARAMVANMVTGVTAGFTRDLEIEGVGYRAEAKGRKLALALGFSHPVEIEVPKGLDVTTEGTNKIRVSGIDRQQVGHFAAELRSIRPPEPYKGKGVRYADERIRRKVGKAGATS